MKILQILFLIIFNITCFISISGQSCGFSFAYFHIRDNKGNLIKNAEIEVFSDKENDPIKDTKIRWIEDENTYILAHEMCGQHSNIGLKISADGFEILEQKINLTFLSQRFIVKLKHIGTSEKTTFEQMASLYGKIFYEKPSISSTTVILTDEKGNKIQTRDYEHYQLDAPSGKYTVEFLQTGGFAPVRIENIYLSKGHNKFDITLKPGINLQQFEAESICKPNIYNKEVSDCTINIKSPNSENINKEEKLNKQ